MSNQASLISALDLQSNAHPEHFERFFSQTERDILKDKFTRAREAVPLCQPGKSLQTLMQQDHLPANVDLDDLLRQWS